LYFFEHLFNTLAMTSGVQQQAYLHHLRLSDAQAATVVKIASEFQGQEQILRQQAAAALSAKSPDMESSLAPIRSQRNALLVGAAQELMRSLGSDGVSRIVEQIQNINARRVKALRK
jgi:type II secretory pathway component GspD/PulD (secretin)